MMGNSHVTYKCLENAGKYGLETIEEISGIIIQMQEYGLRRLSCGVFILTFQVIRGIINATYYGGAVMCGVKKYESFPTGDRWKKAEYKISGILQEVYR